MQNGRITTRMGSHVTSLVAVGGLPLAGGWVYVGGHAWYRSGRWVGTTQGVSGEEVGWRMGCADVLGPPVIGTVVCWLWMPPHPTSPFPHSCMVGCRSGDVSRRDKCCGFVGRACPL